MRLSTETKRKVGVCLATGLLLWFATSSQDVFHHTSVQEGDAAVAVGKSKSLLEEEEAPPNMDDRHTNEATAVAMGGVGNIVLEKRGEEGGQGGAETNVIGEVKQPARRAYVAFLCNEGMLLPTLVLIRSVKRTGTQAAIVVMVTDGVPAAAREKIQKEGVRSVCCVTVVYPNMVNRCDLSMFVQLFVGCHL
jgi:hypothetical protein